MNFEFATTDVESRYRFDYWMAAICDHCLPADSRPLHRPDFDARYSVRDIGGTSFSSYSAPTHYWSRTAEHIRRAPNDDLWLAYVARHGWCSARQAGKTARLSQGDMVIYDGGLPYESAVESKLILLVPLSRHKLTRLVPDIHTHTLEPFNDRQAGGLPLRAMLDLAIDLPPQSMRPAAAAEFGETLLRTLAITLELRGNGSQRHELGIYERTVGYIERNHRDPELDLEALARIHKVSARTISRAFAQHQQTPMSMVWKFRLEASRQQLLEGRAPSVTTAALENGFTDLSHFSRAFKKAFGVSPHTLLRP